MVTMLLIKGHKNWTVSPSLFLFHIHIHTHTQKTQKLMMQHSSWPEGYARSREEEHATSSFVPAAVSVGFTRAAWQQDGTSKTARASFPQDCIRQICENGSVPMGVKLSIFAFAIPYCFTYKVFNPSVTGKSYRFDHWRGWVFLLHFQPRWIIFVPINLSQTQSVHMPVSCQYATAEFRLIKSS